MRNTYTPKILVIDDASVDLEIMTDILTRSGYKVQPVSSGRTALKSVAVEMPDLILLDIKMPDMDGYEVCRCLKSDEKSRGIPVIFISVLDEAADKVEGFNAGGVDFITKPFQPEDVLARVKTHLDLRRLQKQMEIQNVHLIEEIEERKRMEEALRESEQRLSDIINFLPDATFALNHEGKIIAWNQAIEEMTGEKAEDMLGKSDYEYSLPFYGIRRPMLINFVFQHDDEIEKKYFFLKREGNIILAEGNVSIKGKILTLWAKASPLYNSSGSITGAIESIRDITDRKKSEKALKKRERELESKTRKLEELNAALQVLLKQREIDKDDFEGRALSNIKELIIPHIEQLKKSNLKARDMVYISLIESNLKDIISPLSYRLSSKYTTFTPKELQVINLVKEGKPTREIAKILNTSPGTVEFHRNNIRTKLNLKNKRANLRTYLMSL